jgi:hypothetical protein
MTEFGVEEAIFVSGVQPAPALILEETYGANANSERYLVIYSRIRSGIAVVRIWQFDDNCILQVLGLEKPRYRDRRLCLRLKMKSPYRDLQQTTPNRRSRVTDRLRRKLLNKGD